MHGKSEKTQKADTYAGYAAVGTAYAVGAVVFIPVVAALIVTSRAHQQ